MMDEPTPRVEESLIFGVSRPHPYLLIQYLCWSLATVVLFPVAFIPLFFKYHTLRYRFDGQGISMSWGILFRREINLTYSRIQDIHVSRGIIERWLGLGSVAIQTASGSSAAEMTIQGLTIYAELRDFLYSRMRGHRPNAATGGTDADSPGAVSQSEVHRLLTQIHEDLSALRALHGREQGSPRAQGGQDDL